MSEMSDAIEIGWLNEQRTVIKAEFVSGKWTWEDFQKAKQAIATHVAEVGYPCAMLAILPKEFYLPPNAFSNLRHFLIDRDKNAIAFNVIVTPTFFIRKIGTIVNQLVGERGETVQFAETVEQAYDHLRRRGYLQDEVG